MDCWVRGYQTAEHNSSVINYFIQSFVGVRKILVSKPWHKLTILKQWCASKLKENVTNAKIATSSSRFLYFD